MMKFRILNIKDLAAADFEIAFGGMSKERQERCLRYKFLEDRRRMAFGEMLLKKMLCEEYRTSEESISLKSMPSGKPVAYVDGKEIFVSISHSGDFVACALADTPVGIDLEAKREIKPEFIRRVLNESELRFVKSSSSETEAFLKIWTAKEAYLKMTGEGLSGLSKAEVLPFIKGEEKDGTVFKSSNSEHYVCSVIFEQ